jgi:GGDEF domain-containing protein
VSAWFNRGRAFVLAFSLLAAFGALDLFPSRAVYTAAALLVPLNALIALMRPERGARFGQASRWIALLVLEIVVVFFTLETLPLENWLLRSPPTPLVARLLFAAAIAAAVARAWPGFAPLEVGIPAALAAFFIACEWSGAPGTFALFVSAAGFALLVAALHESHRMAFRDALTGLPNRRALDEQLRALGDVYTVAMVDIDHFKAFNDTHGHDTGDQVLKLVAARLAQAEGGGRAFRYGGEEFTVLFPGRGLEEALPQLEKTRASLESYRMALRGGDRPKDKDEGARRRAGRSSDKALFVTVSIGAAASGKKPKTPAEVLKAADKALYRAKQAGRNRVSH